MTVTEATFFESDHDGNAPASPHVHVLFDRCAGCQECLVRCPTGALDLDPETWSVFAHDEACVGCRQCVRTCPFSAITVDGPLVTEPRAVIAVHHPASLTNDRSETRSGIDTWAEALAEAHRCLRCPDPTCVRGCPAHNDIPGFIGAVRDGDLDAAHQILRRTTVLPDVCARVCDQAVQCEGACTWSLGGGSPVAIGALERFVTDNAPVPAFTSPPRATSNSDGARSAIEVAIIGSGPAAIGAAAELVEAGADVTVFERDDEPGGLLRWGIPDFTLPEAPTRRPWEALTAAGVRLVLGTEISAERAVELTDSFDAVVSAIGASVPIQPPLPGTELDGVWDATRFLKRAHDALATGCEFGELRPRSEGGGASGSDRPATVLVLGAGNTAMDVARSARRLGAAAICVDWMDQRFAPVRPDELREAADEGVEVRFCTTLLRLEGEGGRVTTARLAATEQRSSRDRPTLRPHTTVDQPVDLVVLAMGYRIDPEFVDGLRGVPEAKVIPDVPDRHWTASGLLANVSSPFARNQAVGRLALGREHGRVLAGLARADRTWVAGDALVGPSTVVEAMAQGKRAAQSIIHHSPRRPDRSHSHKRSSLRVLIAFESRGGTTASQAIALGTALSDHGASTHTVPLSDVGPSELTWADVLVIGTWVEGLVVAKVGPPRATTTWLNKLPTLGTMPVALFCTYAVSPGKALPTMRNAVEGHGGKVVVEAALSRWTARRPGGAPGLKDLVGTVMTLA
ncbi:MAG: FAD-dependent oxidoreductase [Acidimicrobiales bacterium]